MYSNRFAVEHSNNLCAVSSISLDTFSDSCDHRTCNPTKHCRVFDASCSA